MKNKNPDDYDEINRFKVGDANLDDLYDEELVQFILFNQILHTDSYKASHFNQYPPDTQGTFFYIEPRKGGLYPSTMFFGFQIYLKKYLTRRIKEKYIDEAKEFFDAHGEPFNEEGWRYILEKYNGHYPVIVKAVPEGWTVPEGNVMVTIESSDPKCYWIPGYLETAILRVWYPCTVATNSYYCKKVIKEYLDLTSDDPKAGLPFKLHDFGARGVTCHEQACIGGSAHLVNFMGSDSVEGIWTANKLYKHPMSALSIPAAEHSTITSWGKDGELDAYRNMLKQYAKPGNIFACVSDSYDIYRVCEEYWGGELKQAIIDSGATLVVRPDSGDPQWTVLHVIETLNKKFGYTLNKKGFKLLNYVRVIQGDGINIDTIRAILSRLYINGWSVDNVGFGMGAALLQHFTRDTQRFAMKLSSVNRGGEWRDAFKDPIEDHSKKSKSGRISLYARLQAHGRPELITMRMDQFDVMDSQEKKFYTEVLRPVYINGKLMNEMTLDEVRQGTMLDF